MTANAKAPPVKKRSGSASLDEHASSAAPPSKRRRRAEDLYERRAENRIIEDKETRLERKRAKQDAKRKAKEAAEAEGSRMRGFTLCSMFGTVIHDDDGYRWEMHGFGKPLGARRADAFEAFWALDATLRNDMVEDAESRVVRARVEKPDRDRLLASLKTHRDGLSKLYYQAVAEERSAEKRFIDDERAMVDGLMTEFAAS